MEDIYSFFSRLATSSGSVNLGQGIPCHDTPPDLIDALVNATKKGMNQYSHGFGLPFLREQISKLIYSREGIYIDPESEITITAGATEALYCAITSQLSAGDEAIIFDPGYDSYPPVIEKTGAKAVTVPININELSVDWNIVREKITKNTKLIVINTPQNPTGLTLDKDDFRELREISNSNGLVVISDEVYEDYVYTPSQHIGVLSNCRLHNSFKIGSFGKSFNVTGWKVGYCIAPKKLTDQLRQIHSITNFCISTPFQHAIAEFLFITNNQFSPIAPYYEKKLKVFQEAFLGIDVEFRWPHGGIFSLMDISKISEGRTDHEVALELAEQGVFSSIPLSNFYISGEFESPFLRLCIAKSDEDIYRSAHCLKSYLTQPRKR